MATSRLNQISYQTFPKINLPFLSYSYSTNLKLLIYSYPLTWFMGVDQFIWAIFSLFEMARFLAKQNRIQTCLVLSLAFLFIGMHIPALTQIEENARYFTYLRNVATQAGGIICAFLVFQSMYTIRDINKIILALVTFEVILVISAIFPVLGYDFQFTTPIGAVVLKFTKSPYLTDIFTKSLVHAESLWFADGFLRPKGIMMYVNSMSGIMLGLIPFKYYLSQRSSIKTKILIFLTYALDAVVLIFSLSRSAWGAIVAGIVVVLIFGKISLRSFLFVNIVLAFLGGVFFYSGANDIISSRVLDKTHSNETRMHNYKMIVERATSSVIPLLFGHGTQRDVPELHIPLGSHSAYLGIQFKYGLIALILFMGIQFFTFLGIVRGVHRSNPKSEQRDLLRALLFSLVATSLHIIFTEVDSDAFYSFVWWLVIGLSLCASHLKPTDQNVLKISPPYISLNPASSKKQVHHLP